MNTREIDAQAMQNAKQWVDELNAGSITEQEFNDIVIEHLDMGEEYAAEFRAALATLR